MRENKSQKSETVDQFNNYLLKFLQIINNTLFLIKV
jgi:hypothetical protein